ncbi:hypothetical protein MWU65_03740 [Cellulophaga sp. F20128]|uniref:hypothetical protein n=1 Tax=Cellulophaga sp. F20128 TaxID=2926413 RepID=UPI001FF37EC5|nr:hypothetical protein [Cellulophaga sp. F20128]MCK0156276.1 hypothetical protein [Cellulophaga sp. F20128]
MIAVVHIFSGKRLRPNIKITLIILFGFFIISPVLGQENFDLKSDALISKSFNKNEIEGLESMVRYVDKMVLKMNNQPNINKAYHLLFEKIALSVETFAPIKETEKYQFLKSLNSEQFSAVYEFNTLDRVYVQNVDYQNLTNFTVLDIKPFSKYMDYLKLVGKEDSYFKGIQNKFEMVGGFSAADAYWFPANHAQFDFTIPKNRLWAVIYVLGKEETIAMKLDRYLDTNK